MMPELRHSDSCSLNSGDAIVAASRMWCDAEIGTSSSQSKEVSRAEFPVLVVVDDTKPFGLPSDLFSGASELFDGFGCVKSLGVVVGIGSSIYMNQPYFRHMCAFRFGNPYKVVSKSLQ